MQKTGLRGDLVVPPRIYGLGYARSAGCAYDSAIARTVVAKERQICGSPWASTSSARTVTASAKFVARRESVGWGLRQAQPERWWR